MYWNLLKHPSPDAFPSHRATRLQDAQRWRTRLCRFGEISGYQGSLMIDPWPIKTYKDHTDKSFGNYGRGQACHQDSPSILKMHFKDQQHDGIINRFPVVFCNCLRNLKHIRIRLYPHCKALTILLSVHSLLFCIINIHYKLNQINGFLHRISLSENIQETMVFHMN